MVRVCDAIMGTGKSSAAITYMNEHPEKKFIYVTPYLDEAQRIAVSCPSMKMQKPRKLTEYNGSKTLHTIELVERDENITTTHQAFKYYPQRLLDLIKEKKYTLIIDENVDNLDGVKEDSSDIQMAIDAGYLKFVDGKYHLVKDDYNGTAHKELFKTLKNRDIVNVESNEGELFYWNFPPELITSFEDVFILTYLFDGQSLRYFLDMHNIEYKMIGIDHNDKGEYRFSDSTFYIPEYVCSLPDKIHILDNERLNKIGDKTTSLSISWFKKHKKDLPQLKNNIYNFFRHIASVPAEERMWSTFKDYEWWLKGKGYAGCFIPFNTKATNEYRNRTAIAYCVNVYMNVGQKLYYQRHNVNINEDLWSLSVMLQYIWRSAIRDGKEIYIYIPSSRMRNLLIDWINTVSKGGR